MGPPPACSGLTAPATMEMVRLRLLFSTFTAYRGQTDSQQRPDRPEQGLWGAQKGSDSAARERRVERGGQRDSWPAGENPTSYLLVVQVGEFDAIDFNNLVPCLGEKRRGISILRLSGHLFCWKGSPWRPVSDIGS